MEIEQATIMFDQLGATADEVAVSLTTLGIKGVRNSVRFLNPIVRYAQTQFSKTHELDVMKGNKLRIVLPDGTEQEEPLPKAVLNFLAAFNRGAYPELELPDH